ncbi:MAG: hypothetical protein Q7R88_01905 [bacterium]|nr:hypothetical protein [bacterium]
MKRRYTRWKGRRIWSPAKRKVLLLLEAGVALSFAGTLGRQYKILSEIPEEWKKIDRQYLYRLVHEFMHERLIGMRENKDGTMTAILTEKGRKRVVTVNIDRLKLPAEEKWDGRWHGVLFDIPEKYKGAREALREKLRELGFYPWQKSVFVYPYPCRDQIDFVVEFFEVRRFVRYTVLIDPSNEAELLIHFHLIKP